MHLPTKAIDNVNGQPNPYNNNIVSRLACHHTPTKQDRKSASKQEISHFHIYDKYILLRSRRIWWNWKYLSYKRKDQKTSAGKRKRPSISQRSVWDCRLMPYLMAYSKEVLYRKDTRETYIRPFYISSKWKFIEG